MDWQCVWLFYIYWFPKSKEMIINTSKTFTVLKDQKDGIEDFSKFLTHTVPTRFKDQNLIIDLLPYTNLSLEQLLMFIELSNKHRILNHSFVIVNNALDPDILPDEIMVVPTLLEAQDVIEMEEIERDLGF
jgi:hypothetical protein